MDMAATAGWLSGVEPVLDADVFAQHGMVGVATSAAA